METGTSVKSSKSSKSSCMSRERVLNVVAWIGLMFSFTVLLTSFVVLLLVNIEATQSFSIPRWIDGKLKSFLDKLKSVGILESFVTVLEDHRQILISLSLSIILTYGVYWLIVFFMLIKKISANAKKEVEKIIKFACFSIAINRMLFCLRYAVVYGADFLDKLNARKNEQDLSPSLIVTLLLLGMASIIIFLDLIFSSLVISGLRNNKKFLIKVFLIYTVVVFLLRLSKYILLWIINNEGGVADLLWICTIASHVFFFSFSYSFFKIHHRFLVENSRKEKEDNQDQDQENYIGFYQSMMNAYVEVDSDYEDDDIPIVPIGTGAKILNIHASVTGWLKVSGQRRWGLVYDGALYLYKTEEDPQPERTVDLTRSRREISSKDKTKIRLETGSETLDLTILVDDKNKIDKKIDKWNKCLEQRKQITSRL